MTTPPATGARLWAQGAAGAAVLKEPRPYRDAQDWPRLLDLLMAGRRADNGTYYVHTGDVSWWLYYHDTGAPLSEQIWLWEGGDALLGWVVFTARDGFFDLFVHPALRGTPEAEAMHAWCEARLAAQVKALGGAEIRVGWILADDDWRGPLLTRRGFAARRSDVYMTRALAEPIAASTLPAGFAVRACRGEAEVEARAQAQHGAFGSDWEFGRYVARFRRFMHSPVYAPERDRVVVAGDGRLAAFAIVWLDPINTLGLFEPVGTHPDFQRLGLGRAVILESLRWLQAQGMRQAMVCTSVDNAGAVALYEACGFRIANRLIEYGRPLD